MEGRCADCTFKAICGGGFRVRAWQRYGNPWAEDPGCYLTDEERLGRFTQLKGTISHDRPRTPANPASFFLNIDRIRDLIFGLKEASKTLKSRHSTAMALRYCADSLATLAHARCGERLRIRTSAPTVPSVSVCRRWGSARMPSSPSFLREGRLSARCTACEWRLAASWERTSRWNASRHDFTVCRAQRTEHRSAGAGSGLRLPPEQRQRLL